MDPIVAGTNFEDKAIQQFWTNNCREFSTWFLLLSAEDRERVVKQAGPDLPERGPAQGTAMKPTDLLLPELTMAGMLAGDGRCLILFFTRRAVEKADADDIRMLNTLNEKKIMPLFSDGKLAHLKNGAYVSPHDPQENIVAVPANTTDKNGEAIKQGIANGSLVDAEVWLAKRVRQQAIFQFLGNMIDTFYKEGAKKKGRSQGAKATTETSE